MYCPRRNQNDELLGCYILMSVRSYVGLYSLLRHTSYISQFSHKPGIVLHMNEKEGDD